MKKGIIAALLVLAALLLTVGAALNPMIGVTNYSFVSEKTPPSLDGYKIAVIADMHSLDYTLAKPEIEKKLREIKPDLIALAGDIYDINVDTAKGSGLTFFENISGIAPCVYVTGNHESAFSEAEREYIKAECRRIGIICPEGGTYQASGGDGKIYITALDDPREVYGARLGEHLDWKLGDEKDESALQILIFHRANLLDMLSGHGFDLILSGHTHGGQIRLPFVGGLMSPDLATWFPKYSGGLYTLEGGTQAVVSRGLGNTKDIPRVFNSPEIVVVTLKRR